jgi:hypothetical protein
MRIRIALTRADWLAVILAAALLPGLYLRYWGDHGPAAMVRISASGQPDISVPLDTNHRFAVHGPLGDSVIEVRDGRVRFVSSPCRGKQCVHSGWLSRAGELAACLPNGVMVSILGRDRRYDSINF